MYNIYYMLKIPICEYIKSNEIKKAIYYLYAKCKLDVKCLIMSGYSYE